MWEEMDVRSNMKEKNEKWPEEYVRRTEKTEICFTSCNLGWMSCSLMPGSTKKRNGQEGLETTGEGVVIT